MGLNMAVASSVGTALQDQQSITLIVERMYDTPRSTAGAVTYSGF